MADRTDTRANRMKKAAATPTTATASGVRLPPPPPPPPYLPTGSEAVLLAVFPALLVFGAVFGRLSPEGRVTTTGAAAEAHGAVRHGAATAPNYFARKDNVLNVVFVKRGWFWISLAFGLFVATHASFSRRPGRRLAAGLRWMLVTAWWIVVTQWSFGPPLIDRGFRLTGGGCTAAEMAAGMADASSSASSVEQKLRGLATVAACRRAGGAWSGGHDISGHVFMLVLGAVFLAQETGWVLWRDRRIGGVGVGGPVAPASSSSLSGTRGGRVTDYRRIVMADGAVKSAEVEAAGGAPSPTTTLSSFSPFALRFVAVIEGLSLWMLLMTAIYFHTWKEKLSGLLVALVGLYGVYIVPRWVPAVRRVVGMPGL